MLSAPELIITIHGVGEHEQGQVAKEIAVGLGVSASIPVVDFNWCKTVEAYEQDKILELSCSIATANSQGSPSLSFWLTRLPSNAAELIWGYLFLIAAMIPLLFAPTLFLYLLSLV